MAHLLEMKNICKSFSGVSVLKNNHLELEAGEVHALLGENGAGKSTLIKILGGVYTKDSGQILVDGQEVEITGVESAKEHGIRIIHQELMLIPDMTISENIFIGQEPKTKAGTVDKKKMNEMAQGFLDSMHLDLKSTQFIRDLNIAQQQMVEIIRAISFGAKIIVMDEPTSSLTENEVDALFEAIKALKAKNVGIIYISHRMAELDAITDRITVMRDGEYIDTVVTKETTHDDLVALMVGRKLGDLYQKHENYSDDIILKVEKLASVNVAEWVFLQLFLPCTQLYVLLSLAGHLSSKDLFSKALELLEQGMRWGSKALLGVVLGFHVLQGMIAPYTDSMRQTALRRAVSLIPGIGQGAAAVSQVLLGSSVLIRNTVGIGGVLVLAAVSLLPLLKLLILYLGCQGSAALLQPVSDSRVVEAVGAVSAYLFLLNGLSCRMPFPALLHKALHRQPSLP